MFAREVCADFGGRAMLAPTENCKLTRRQQAAALQYAGGLCESRKRDDVGIVPYDFAGGLHKPFVGEGLAPPVKFVLIYGYA